MFMSVALTIWLLTVYCVPAPMRPAPASRSLMNRLHILPFLITSLACGIAQAQSENRWAALGKTRNRPPYGMWAEQSLVDMRQLELESRLYNMWELHLTEVQAAISYKA
jgi:hypothetical protein